MTYQSFTHTVLLGCMLLILTGPAKADIVQCTNSSGMVTYTDVPCKLGSDSAPVSTVADIVEAKPKASSPQAFVLGQKVQETPWANKPASGRNFPLDVATAKMARSSFLEIDAERTFLHQQRMLALK